LNLVEKKEKEKSKEPVEERKQQEKGKKTILKEQNFVNNRLPGHLIKKLPEGK